MDFRINQNLKYQTGHMQMKISNDDCKHKLHSLSEILLDVYRCITNQEGFALIKAGL